MSEHVQLFRHVQHADAVNALLIGMMAERFAQMGADEGGLYGFYSERLKHGQGLIHYDIGLAEWITKNVPKTDVIVDIGSGFGQFPILLAANGYASIAAEIDLRRHTGLLRAIEAVRYLNPEWARLITPLFQNYPSPIEAIAGRRSLGVFACFVGTATLEEERAMIAGLRQFTSSIIDLSRFGRMKRDTPEQVAEFRNMLTQEGIEIVAPVLAWDYGQYVLVRPV
jgi:hypothetical protein